MKIPTRFRLLITWLVALLKLRHQRSKTAWIADPVVTLDRQIAAAEIVMANFWHRNPVDEFIKLQLRVYIEGLKDQKVWFKAMQITTVGFIPRG